MNFWTKSGTGCSDRIQLFSEPDLELICAVFVTPVKKVQKYDFYQGLFMDSRGLTLIVLGEGLIHHSSLKAL